VAIFSEGFFCVYINKKAGFIDIEGDLLIPCELVVK
jgi:hypothetical protein